MANAKISEHLIEISKKNPCEFNAELNQILPWPFRAIKATAIDSTGLKTEVFSTIIYTVATEQVEEPIEIQADTLACVIDVYDTINLENLRISYRRIADAKKLKKKPTPPSSSGIRNETFGVVLAIESSISLNEVADELQQLNQKIPCSQWPDLIVVLSQGTIHYAVQFPGEKTLSHFLLPSKEILKASIPAFYVIPVISPTGQYTFNKMCALIFGHLGTFSPGSKLPSFEELLENASRIFITQEGYQYNLQGELLPVPTEYYKGR